VSDPLQFRFHNGGLHFPRLGLWMDPHEAVQGDELVFVSHAHSDHTGNHRHVLFTDPTRRLMRARVAGERTEHVLEFGRRYDASDFGRGRNEFTITLYPAGHIFGSAMALLEAGGTSLLYTGDFKLRRGLSAEPCEPVHADRLVMETTYGRPHYVFPPTPAVIASVTRFCREALDNDEIPLLLGYSLGKSQEILSGLAGAGLPLMLHDAVAKLTRIYAELGHPFPAWTAWNPSAASGHVLIAPPGGSAASLKRKLGSVRTATLTGWSVDPGARFRSGTDASFPLSDHADFPDLIEFVKRVAPREVFTLHGFAAEFASRLRFLGFQARSLSEEEQLELKLVTLSEEAAPHRPETAVSCQARPGSNEAARVELAGAAGYQGFAAFAATCEAIRATPAKLAKVASLSEFLRSVPDQDLPDVTVWFTGLAFPPGSGKQLNIGWAALREALCQAAGVTGAEFRNAHLKHSDTGEAAAELIRDARSLRPRPGEVSGPLRLSDMATLFRRLSTAKGPSGKIPLLAGAFSSCSANEARYLAKIITGDLRIGLKEGLVEDAVAVAFSSDPEEVRRAHMLLGDLGETALLARTSRLSDAGLVPFRPIKVMLASPEPTAQAVFDRAQERQGGTATPELWVEEKYDGIRCQLHKVADRVSLFSRDLKDVTSTFPEIADAARKLDADVILDGEILALDGERTLGFSELQKRLGRREGDLFLGGEIPVRFVAFDILWRNGTTCIDRPLQERRAALEALQRPEELRLALVRHVAGVEEIEAAFNSARERGHEGLIIKDAAGAYTPGRRGLGWIKLKKAFATLDCVVVAAEYGHGRRKDVLSDYTFAVREERTGALRNIGKAYSGLTDAEIAMLTRRFLSSVIRKRGRVLEVTPEVVLEIAFDSLKPSDRHDSGLAMRFPRINRIRDDKTAAQIDTLDHARKLAGVGA
jgi:DNA ligase-1